MNQAWDVGKQTIFLYYACFTSINLSRVLLWIECFVARTLYEFYAFKILWY